jgi:hypothetical protein
MDCRVVSNPMEPQMLSINLVRNKPLNIHLTRSLAKLLFDQVHVLCSGSVIASNVRDYRRLDEVDGALVSGGSQPHGLGRLDCILKKSS